MMSDERGAERMNALARNLTMLNELRDRVRRRDFVAARRLALALQLHPLTPQELFEQDDDYLRRLVRVHAPRRQRRGAGKAAA